MVNSFTEYWEEIKKLIPHNDDEILFLRGQANGDYEKMVPGVCRDKFIDEQYEYQQIQIDYPEEFKKHAHLSNLVKMQHYGCNTRLLDFTLNPLIALYFATESEQTKDGKVFAITVNKKDILFQNSDRAMMLSCLPPFSKEDKNAIKDFCVNHPDKITNQNITFSPVMQRFLHEIRGEYPSFETAIIGNDLLCYFFVRPHKDNERMRVQEGAFAIFGLNEDALVDDINSKAEIIEIKATAKKDILKDLNIMRINTSTMYPGLERRAMLNRNKMAHWGNLLE